MENPLDREVTSKMAGIWQITKAPGLQATVEDNNIGFWWHPGKTRVRLGYLTTSMFMHLAPVEVVHFIEREISRQGFDPMTWRNDFVGFSKNPLGSQA